MQQVIDVDQTVTQRGRRMTWQEALMPIGIALCQLMSVVSFLGVMLVLTPRLSLAIPYAIFLGLSMSSLLSLVFTKSAITAKAVDIIIKTPGGLGIIAFSGVIAALIWHVQPVLVANGYTRLEAVAVTILAQIPLATASSVLSGRFLSRIFNERWYKMAVDAMLRELSLRRKIDRVEIIRNALKDVVDIAKDHPMEPQLRALLADVELRLKNLTKTVELLCERQPRYMPVVYHTLLARVLSHAKAKLTDQQSPALTQHDAGAATGLSSELDDIAKLHVMLGAYRDSSA